MSTVTADVFSPAIASALERMAFVFAEPCDDTPGEILAATTVHACIEIQAEKAMTLSLSVSPGFVREVASGMLGIDAEDVDVDDHGRTVATELANVLGGELVMVMTGGEQDASLGLPRESTDEEVGALLERCALTGFHCGFAVEGSRLLVAVDTV